VPGARHVRTFLYSLFPIPCLFVFLHFSLDNRSIVAYHGCRKGAAPRPYVGAAPEDEMDPAKAGKWNKTARLLDPWSRPCNDPKSGVCATKTTEQTGNVDENKGQGQKVEESALRCQESEVRPRTED
jgi:hypothetical protein